MLIRTFGAKCLGIDAALVTVETHIDRGVGIHPLLSRFFNYSKFSIFIKTLVLNNISEMPGQGNKNFFRIMNTT